MSDQETNSASYLLKLFISNTYRSLTARFRCLSNTLIIGAQRSGTSSLFHYLKQHPQISTSNIKEVHYYDEQYEKGQLWYQRHFPYRINRSKIVLEATPYYLFHPSSAERILHSAPHAKLIVILRDPVQRAYSHYQMVRKMGIESEPTFERALEKEKGRLNGEKEKITGNVHYKSLPHKMMSYLERGKYADQLASYINLFGRDNIHIIISESFYQNPQLILDTLLEFLQIDPFTFELNLSLIHI